MGLLFAIIHSYLVDVIAAFLSRLFSRKAATHPSPQPRLSAAAADNLEPPLSH